MKNHNTTLKENEFKYENNFLVLEGNDDVLSFLEYLTNQLDDIDVLNIFEAMFRLYVCYVNGKGVRKNLKRATDYLFKSAVQGYQDAINEIKRLKELIEGLDNK